MRRLALLLILLAPLAHAHGDAGSFDPLVVEMHGHLAVDGAIVEPAPEPGLVPFPVPAPPAAPPALRFTWDAPVRFSAGSGFVVELTLRADRVVVPRGEDGNAFELSIEPGGEPVRVALAEPVLAPGAIARASVVLQAPGAEYAKGDAIALTIRPLMPGLTEGALSIVVGGDAPSRLDVPDMRVPSVADLELQEGPLVEFKLGSETFGGKAHVVRVTHTAVSYEETAGATHVVFLGEESDGDAQAHAFPDRARRIEAAHAFTVNDMLVRVHPGVGVAAPFAGEIARIKCIGHCPVGGSMRTFGVEGAVDAGERPSALIPPPRDTSGIPVSEDEPPRETPLPPVAIAALLLAALALGRGR